MQGSGRVLIRAARPSDSAVRASGKKKDAGPYLFCYERGNMTDLDGASYKVYTRIAISQQTSIIIQFCADAEKYPF